MSKSECSDNNDFMFIMTQQEKYMSMEHVDGVVLPITRNLSSGDDIRTSTDANRDLSTKFSSKRIVSK